MPAKDKHFLTVYSAGKPNEYRGLCGYTSTDPKEFTSISNPSLKDVTCAACLERALGAVMIMKAEEE